MIRQFPYTVTVGGVVVETSHDGFLAKAKDPMIIRVDTPEGDAADARLKELRAERSRRQLSLREVSELDSLEARATGRPEGGRPHLL